MTPASFDQSNYALSAPATMAHGDECEALSVFRGENVGGQPVVISCWKMSREELEEVNRTGRVWLVVAGVTMPPAYLVGTNPWAAELEGQSDG